MGNTCCCSSCFANSQQDYADVIAKLARVEEMSHIDELISYIDQILNAINERRINSIGQLTETNRVAASINSSAGLLQTVLQRSRHCCKRDIIPRLDRETRKLVIDVTNQGTHIQWLGIALSVLAFVLERIDQISSNGEDSIQLLSYMCNLAKYIKQLEDHLAQEKLKNVLQFIVQGSLFCISQMESHALSKFFAAPVAGRELQKLKAELTHKYLELSLEAMIAVLNRSSEVLDRLPLVLPPSQGRSPQAGGIEEAIDNVTKLLDVRSSSVKVVVIYGQGGIGKTTLATAVFSKLDLKNYKYCRVDIQQNCSEDALKSLQQQILKDLYDCNIQLRSLNEGQEELAKYFKEHSSQPVFVFIDNALKQSDLEKLLPVPDLASLPPQSRILLTTRNLNETQIVVQARIERPSYKVRCLPEEEAHKLLCMSALGSEQASFSDPTIAIDGLLRICQGIPLVLKLAGARLCEYTQPDLDVRACREAVETLKSELLRGEEDDLSERMVDFVYNRLKASCKEAFIDIVFLFCNWERDLVAYTVGQTEFEELQRAALVNVTNEGKVNVHDIVQARGRMLSPDGERITNLQSLTEVLQDEERIKKIKWISLSGPCELEGSHLSLMKGCLRVLDLGMKLGGPVPVTVKLIETGHIIDYIEPQIQLNGECKVAFENLRLLRLVNVKNYALVQDVSKHFRLAVLILKLETLDEVCKFEGIIPSSVKYMDIKNVTFDNLTNTTSQLRSLRSLTLEDCSGFDSLPETIGNLPALEELSLVCCRSLVRLSDSFGKLSYLKTLILFCCENLVSLPDSFGHLSSLNILSLRECENLVSLPDNFGNLCCLTKLFLGYCTRLSVLPESFGNLASLQLLTLRGCEKISNLPHSFGQLKSLEYLGIHGCRALQSVSSNFECLSSLISIDASECPQLDENAMEKLAKLKGLMVVNIIESPRLIKRWQQVKEQHSLAVVEIDISGMPDDDYPYADVMRRAFFHSESKLVSCSDENGELVESPSPAGAVKLWIVLRESTSVTSSSSSWEAIKKKWEEVVALEGGQMIYVDVGGACEWEERVTRVRQALPHLPSGARAWISPEERARILFAHSVQLYYYTHGEVHAEAYKGVQNCIVSTSTRVDEEGRRLLDELEFILPDLPTTVECQDISEQLLSPIKEGILFLLRERCIDNVHHYYRAH